MPSTLGNILRSMGMAKAGKTVDKLGKAKKRQIDDAKYVSVLRSDANAFLEGIKGIKGGLESSAISPRAAVTQLVSLATEPFRASIDEIKTQVRFSSEANALLKNIHKKTVLLVEALKGISSSSSGGLTENELEIVKKATRAFLVAYTKIVATLLESKESHIYQFRSNFTEFRKVFKEARDLIVEKSGDQKSIMPDKARIETLRTSMLSSLIKIFAGKGKNGKGKAHDFQTSIEKLSFPVSQAQGDLTSKLQTNYNSIVAALGVARNFLSAFEKAANEFLANDPVKDEKSGTNQFLKTLVNDYIGKIIIDYKTYETSISEAKLGEPSTFDGFKAMLNDLTKTLFTRLNNVGKDHRYLSDIYDFKSGFAVIGNAIHKFFLKMSNAVDEIKTMSVALGRPVAQTQTQTQPQAASSSEIKREIPKSRPPLPPQQITKVMDEVTEQKGNLEEALKELQDNRQAAIANMTNYVTTIVDKIADQKTKNKYNDECEKIIEEIQKSYADDEAALKADIKHLAAARTKIAAYQAKVKKYEQDVKAAQAAGKQPPQQPQPPGPMQPPKESETIKNEINLQNPGQTITDLKDVEKKADEKVDEAKEQAKEIVGGMPPAPSEGLQKAFEKMQQQLAGNGSAPQQQPQQQLAGNGSAPQQQQQQQSAGGGSAPQKPPPKKPVSNGKYKGKEAPANVARKMVEDYKKIEEAKKTFAGRKDANEGKRFGEAYNKLVEEFDKAYCEYATATGPGEAIIQYPVLMDEGFSVKLSPIPAKSFAPIVTKDTSGPATGGQQSSGGQGSSGQQNTGGPGPAGKGGQRPGPGAGASPYPYAGQGTSENKAEAQKDYEEIKELKKRKPGNTEQKEAFKVEVNKKIDDFCKKYVTKFNQMGLSCPLIDERFFVRTMEKITK